MCETQLEICGEPDVTVFKKLDRHCLHAILHQGLLATLRLLLNVSHDNGKGQLRPVLSTVESRYNEDFGTMKIPLLNQVSGYIRVKNKKQRNVRSWDQQNYLVIKGYRYI